MRKSTLGHNVIVSLVKSDYDYDEYGNREKKDAIVQTFKALYAPIEDNVTISVTGAINEDTASLYIKDRSVIIEPTDTFIIMGEEWYQSANALYWNPPSGFKMNKAGVTIKIKRKEQSNV